MLEVVSKPFTKRYADAYRFGQSRTCPDGIVTDFEFIRTENAAHAWRFLDLSSHARYLSEVLKQTVEHEMAEEAWAPHPSTNAAAIISPALIGTGSSARGV